MKQLLILSGKGGTGKTTVASAFIRLSEARAYADCDVDAPNLHLVMAQHAEPKRSDYYGLPKAEISQKLCIRCGRCAQSCRFEAISKTPPFMVDALACEGCGVCEAVCPAAAVSLVPAVPGEVMLYSDEKSAFSTARLKIGSGNSGKLVAEVKKQMKSASPSAGFAVVDGPPGIGCPVIASLSGVSMVLFVTEPSLSAISDLKRVVRTARAFRAKMAVCINKCDVNVENSKSIAKYCEEEAIPLVGTIPYDPEAVKALNCGLTVADLDCPSGRAIREIYEKTMQLLESGTTTEKEQAR